MKGFVPTPESVVDSMVKLLFQDRAPSRQNTVLDPGSGTGEFIAGIIRWCAARGVPVPQITGVESDPRLILILRSRFKDLQEVSIEHCDFLEAVERKYDYVVGNPPYVPITGLTEIEKRRYRARYSTARGRFDLYLLFFEEALRCLRPEGRLVFITPEKFLYVESAAPLRALLAQRHVEQVRLVSEDTFGDLVTYPTITVVRQTLPGMTQIVRRDGTSVSVNLPPHGESWSPFGPGGTLEGSSTKLAELCSRVSCGVATGADRAFVQSASGLDPQLSTFAYPTMAGRELPESVGDLIPHSVMLVPYDLDGHLIPLEQLGALRDHLMNDDVRQMLLARTCVQRKPWYAFHETPLLREILRPKILCKDIGQTPRFWIDRSGEIVPRHSVYYIVPKNPFALDIIADYLQSHSAQEWLRQNCQHAAKGFLRLQSHVLQRLPVPDEVARAVVRVRPFVGNEVTPQQAAIAFL